MYVSKLNQIQLQPASAVKSWEAEKGKGEIMVATISRNELREKIDRREQFLLVETLPETAYHHAHLPGAINLPPDQVTVLAPTLLPDKDAEIVVYCASPT